MISMYTAPPAPPAYLTSTQDLLARFQLLPAYDKYVRPYVTPSLENGIDYITGVDKGKGKEREREREPVTASPAAQTPGADGADVDDEEGGGHGEKKKKNSYKHLIKGVPGEDCGLLLCSIHTVLPLRVVGKHSMKKDDYLMTIMQIPPKQRIPITQFDSKTQREAFTVSLEGLKGVRILTYPPNFRLVFDSTANLVVDSGIQVLWFSNPPKPGKTGKSGFVVLPSQYYLLLFTPYTERTKEASKSPRSSSCYINIHPCTATHPEPSSPSSTDNNT
jgi:hypothetical protein